MGDEENHMQVISKAKKQKCKTPMPMDYAHKVLADRERVRTTVMI